MFRREIRIWRAFDGIRGKPERDIEDKIRGGNMEELKGNFSGAAFQIADRHHKVALLRWLESGNL